MSLTNKEKEILDYCKNDLNWGWAFRICGIILDCDCTEVENHEYFKPKKKRRVVYYRHLYKNIKSPDYYIWTTDWVKDKWEEIEYKNKYELIETEEREFEIDER